MVRPLAPGARGPAGVLRGASARKANPQAPWRNQFAGRTTASGVRIAHFEDALTSAESPQGFAQHLAARGLALTSTEASGRRTLTGSAGKDLELTAVYGPGGRVASLRQTVRTEGGMERHLALHRQGAWHLASYQADYRAGDVFGGEATAPPWKNQFAGQKSASGATIHHFSEAVEHASSPAAFRDYLLKQGHVPENLEPEGDLEVRGGGIGARFSRSGAPIHVFSHVTTPKGSEQHRAEAQMGGRFSLSLYRAQYENPEAHALPAAP